MSHPAAEELERVHASGEAIARIPAGRRSAYDRGVFEIAAGDEREIALRNKE